MELAIYEAFRDAGIDEKPAKVIAATVNKAVEQSVDTKQLATKSDVENGQVRTDVEKLRIETKTEFGLVRAELEKLRLETKAEIEKAKTDIIKWNIGAIIAASGLAMAIARLFFTNH